MHSIHIKLRNTSRCTIAVNSQKEIFFCPPLQTVFPTIPGSSAALEFFFLVISSSECFSFWPQLNSCVWTGDDVDVAQHHHNILV